jgi:hypothetical protein
VNGPPESRDLMAQARALLDLIRELQRPRLTPDEADAVAMLIQALRWLIGEEEDGRDA